MSQTLSVIVVITKKTINAIAYKKTGIARHIRNRKQTANTQQQYNRENESEQSITCK